MGVEFSFWGDESVLELVFMVTHNSETVLKPLSCVLKRVNFMVCELYRN